MDGVTSPAQHSNQDRCGLFAHPGPVIRVPEDIELASSAEFDSWWRYAAKWDIVGHDKTSLVWLAQTHRKVESEREEQEDSCSSQQHPR